MILLEKLITSNDDALDSRKAEISLNNLVKLIRRNQKNVSTSFWTIRSLKEFTWSYLVNLAKEPNASPYIRAAVPTIQEAILKAESQLQEVINEGTGEIESQLTVMLPAITRGGRQFRLPHLDLSGTAVKDDVPELPSPLPGDENNR